MKLNNRPNGLDMLWEYLSVVVFATMATRLAVLYQENVANGWNDAVTDALFFGALFCAIPAIGFTIALIIDLVRAYKSDNPPRRPMI